MSPSRRRECQLGPLGKKRLVRQCRRQQAVQSSRGILTLSGTLGHLLLALLASQRRLLLLLHSLLVLLNRLPELITEILKDLKALLQLEGAGIFAKEIRQLEPQRFHLRHAGLEHSQLRLGALQKLQHLLLDIRIRGWLLDLSDDLLDAIVQRVDLVVDLLRGGSGEEGERISDVY